MCSHPTGDVWAISSSGTAVPADCRWATASAMYVEFQQTIAAMTRFSPEARYCCASWLRSMIRPCRNVHIA